VSRSSKNFTRDVDDFQCVLSARYELSFTRESVRLRRWKGDRLARFETSCTANTTVSRSFNRPQAREIHNDGILKRPIHFTSYH